MSKAADVGAAATIKYAPLKCDVKVLVDKPS